MTAIVGAVVTVTSALVAWISGVAELNIKHAEFAAQLELQKATAAAQLDLQRAAADEGVTQHYLDKATNPEASLDSRHAVLRFLVIALEGKPINTWATKELEQVTITLNERAALAAQRDEALKQAQEASKRAQDAEAELAKLRLDDEADKSRIAELEQLANAEANARDAAIGQANQIDTSLSNLDPYPLPDIWTVPRRDGSGTINYFPRLTDGNLSGTFNLAEACRHPEVGFSSFVGLSRGATHADVRRVLGEPTRTDYLGMDEWFLDDLVGVDYGAEQRVLSIVIGTFDATGKADPTKVLERLKSTSASDPRLLLLTASDSELTALFGPPSSILEDSVWGNGFGKTEGRVMVMVYRYPKRVQITVSWL